ncbi:MAG: lysoplasmalogenase [Promethearchaeota archaeon]|nr:MAG: lysoplasmalogenase [Candidatus Lokiarchaeota archaeon]
MIEYIFLILFFIIVIIELYGESKDNTKIFYASKPLAMPLLILFYIFGVINGVGVERIDWLIVVALIGGMTGDILLMLKNQEKWFLFGMIGFLINQIFYIISFFIGVGDITTFNIWALFLFSPVILIIAFTVPRFIKKTEDLKIPVLVYMGAILLMHVATVVRIAAIQEISTIFIYFGSILFVFSDSILAMIKWEGEFKHGRLINLTTYFLAQFYITLGALFMALL